MITAIEQSESQSPSLPVSESPQSQSLFAPPTCSEFHALPDAVRRDVRRWLSVLKVVDSADRVSPACKALAAQMQHIPGFSFHRIRTQYYTYIRTGDWNDLVNWSKVGSSKIKLPAAFIAYWQQLCEDNQRKDAPAYRELKHIWHTHHTSRRDPVKSIPGYKDWPTAERGSDLPVGWSYGNLNRYSPSKFEKAAARQGRQAAAEHRQKVITTRKGLRLGEFILFDDQVYDQKVNFLARRQSKAMRPVGYNAIDLLSACCVTYSFKPVLWNEHTQAKEMLKEIDFIWFVVNYLLTFGYRTDDRGTKAIVESGTAVIRGDFAQRIADATGGKFIAEPGKTNNSPAFDGLFEGPSKGNFRYKAAIESFFNLVRNEFASLPGQVGKDRDHSPADLHGRDRYNEKILKAALALPPEQAALLQLPFLEWNQFTEVAMDLYRRINWRTEHDLEGWIKCGHIANEFTLPASQSQITEGGPQEGGRHANGWFHMEHFSKLAPEQRIIVKAILDSDPSLTRSRKMAPQEVWNQHRHELTPLPAFTICALLGPEHGTERAVKNGVIIVDDQDIDPDPVHFDPVLNRQKVRDGQSFLTFVNPFNPSALYACDARGGYLGEFPRIIASCRNDLDSLHRQMGKVKHYEAQALAAIAGRHVDKAQEKIQMHQKNADVIQQSIDGLTPADRKRQRSAGRGGLTLEDLAEEFGEPNTPCSPRGNEGDSPAPNLKSQISDLKSTGLTMEDLTDL